MDFGGARMEKKVCGAKTRKGTPCQKTALKNGKCRNHGGKSTGPKDKEKLSNSLKGNKNAVKTGEYETISYATLTEVEKELYEQINTDPATQIEGRLKIAEIRTYRLMQRYLDELEKQKPNESLILNLEAALIRIDSRAFELLREKIALQEGNKADDNNGSLAQLNIILNDIRDQREQDLRSRYIQK